MRYLVEGVARDVASGKRVLVAMPRMMEAREVFRRVGMAVIVGPVMAVAGVSSFAKTI